MTTFINKTCLACPENLNLRLTKTIRAFPNPHTFLSFQTLNKFSITTKIPAKSSEIVTKQPKRPKKLEPNWYWTEKEKRPLAFGDWQRKLTKVGHNKEWMLAKPIWTMERWAILSPLMRSLFETGKFSFCSCWIWPSLKLQWRHRFW